jgi:hypothetical protein
VNTGEALARLGWTAAEYTAMVKAAGPSGPHFDALRAAAAGEPRASVLARFFGGRDPYVVVAEYSVDRPAGRTVPVRRPPDTPAIRASRVRIRRSRGMSYRAIGDQFGLTPERIRQIVVRGDEKDQADMAASVLRLIRRYGAAAACPCCGTPFATTIRTQPLTRAPGRRR